MGKHVAGLKLMYTGLVIFLSLPVLCLGEATMKTDFKGAVTYKCFEPNSNETFECMSDYMASLTYKTKEGSFAQSCNVSTLRSNFTDGFQRQRCTIAYFLSESIDKSVSLHFPKKPDPQTPPKCIGDLDVTVNKECNPLMTVEQLDFLQMCNVFRVKNISTSCNCDMFDIEHQGFRYGLCNILNKTENYTTSSVTLTGRENLYESILKRSCLYVESNKQCNCSDFRIIRGDKVEGFCSSKSIEELCKLLGLSMDECHCSLFEQEKKESACDIIGNNKIVEIQYEESNLMPYAIGETVASAIGIFGNLLVILVTFRFRSGLGTCKLLMAHLAAYDLCFACVQLIFAIPKFWTSEFIYGKIACKILRSADYLGALLGIGVILTISIERFTGIVNPFKKVFTRKSIRWVLLVNFIFAVGAIIPQVLYYDVDEQLKNCKLKWAHDSHGIAYHVSIMVIYLCIPVLIISTLYSIIIATLRGTLSSGNSVIVDPRIREKRVQDNRRTLYILMSVVVAFVLFVFPQYTVNIYMQIAEGSRRYVSDKEMSVGSFFALVQIIQLSYPFHVAVNPIIYSLIDSRWRKDAWLFLTCAPSRQRCSVQTSKTRTTQSTSNSSINSSKTS